MYAAVALLAGGFLIGCAASGVARARAEIAKGNYSAAHHELELAAADRSRLSRRDVRELNDALCLTEYKIGAPSYSMAEQQRACSEAATLDGSQSGPLLATIEQNRRAALSDAIENSLAQGDIAEAEQQIRDYRSIPGDDDVAVAKWSREVWSLVRERDHRHAKEHAGRIEPAISAVARQYPEVKTMNDRRFRQWIERNATVSGTPLVSEVEIGRRTVNLWVTDGSRPAAALNLDRFARINDALIARCRCDGHTNVALKGSGLPAYLVRLDPEIRQSEVIILSNP
ncbi:MAG TPA: hypothetical protein VJ718_10755 [Candidatus Binataceae bacterium]|nr:hypothetical protein [Candidatus Binataceae bacterium]